MASFSKENGNSSEAFLPSIENKNFGLLNSLIYNLF